MAIHTAVERITPVQAERYLETNTINRSMRQNHVYRLSSDMKEGRWQMNGASIVFNGDGTLLDGQHRLSAIVHAGVPVDMLVVRGVSKAAMSSIDANISRKASDAAQLAGYSNTNNLVGTARILMNVKTGGVFTSERSSTGAVMQFLRMHPHLQDSTDAACRLSKVIPVTTTAAWHYLAFYVGGMREEASAAIKVMETGIPNYPNDAIHAFRERVLRDRYEFHGGISKRMRALWTLALAWNDFIVKSPRQLCRIQQSEVFMDGVDYNKL